MEKGKLFRREPKILITDVDDFDCPEMKAPESPRPISVDAIPIVTFSTSESEEDLKHCLEQDQKTETEERRPSTLVAVVKPIQAKQELTNPEEDVLSLSQLPSPLERSGSIVGDPQLPVPPEFEDKSFFDEGEDELDPKNVSFFQNFKCLMRRALA